MNVGGRRLLVAGSVLWELRSGTIGKKVQTKGCTNTTVQAGRAEVGLLTEDAVEAVISTLSIYF